LSARFGFVVLCAVPGLCVAQAAAERLPFELTRRVSPTTDDLHAVCFVDAAHGWIATHASGRVLRTTDAGATWESITQLEPGYIEWISFRDADHGWLCGEHGRLCATGDGGRTWRCHDEPGDEAALSVVHFRDDEHGFATGMRIRDRSSVVLVTDDGGRSWRDRSKTVAGRGMTDALVTIDPTTTLVGGFGAVWRTDRDGADWMSVAAPNGAVVRGLAVQPRETVWAVGHHGLALVSKDAGRTWQRRESFTNGLLRGVVFVSENTGLIFGSRDGAGHTLWHTENGGDFWASVPRELPELHRAAVTTERIWLVGAGGAIYTLDRPAGEAD